MSDINKNLQKKKGINPVVAGVAGAVVGVGVAVAATQLKDGKNRKKITKALYSVKDQTSEYIENFRKDAEEKKDESVKKIKKSAGKKNKRIKLLF